MFNNRTAPYSPDNVIPQAPVPPRDSDKALTTHSEDFDNVIFQGSVFWVDSDIINCLNMPLMVVIFVILVMKWLWREGILTVNLRVCPREALGTHINWCIKTNKITEL